jgi:hypothetical protein
MKTILRDFNGKVGKESYLYKACGGHTTAFTTEQIIIENGR